MGGTAILPVIYILIELNCNYWTTEMTTRLEIRNTFKSLQVAVVTVGQDERMLVSDDYQHANMEQAIEHTDSECSVWDN